MYQYTWERQTDGPNIQTYGDPINLTCREHPNYEVRYQWRVYRDGVTRRYYNAYLRVRTGRWYCIGEIMGSTQLQSVIQELEDYISANGRRDKDGQHHADAAHGQ